jgi:hypothetical protein
MKLSWFFEKINKTFFFLDKPLPKIRKRRLKSRYNWCHRNTKGCINLFTYLSLKVLGFELRGSHLLGRHSVTWAPLPTRIVRDTYKQLHTNTLDNLEVFSVWISLSRHYFPLQLIIYYCCFMISSLFNEKSKVALNIM